MGLGQEASFLEAPANPVPGLLELSICQRSCDPVMALATLVQCFDDSLAHFEVVELTGLQVPVNALETGTQPSFGYLVSVFNWFNTGLKAGADTTVAFYQDPLGSHDVSELFATLQHRNTDPLKSREFVIVPEKYMLNVPVETPFRPIASNSELGIFHHATRVDGERRGVGTRQRG